MIPEEKVRLGEEMTALPQRNLQAGIAAPLISSHSFSLKSATRRATMPKRALEDGFVSKKHKGNNIS